MARASSKQGEKNIYGKKRITKTTERRKSERKKNIDKQSMAAYFYIRCEKVQQHFFVYDFLLFFFVLHFFFILYFVVERSFRSLKAYCCYPLFASLECLFVRSRKSFIANHIWISIYFVGFFFSRCIRQPALGTREAIHHQQCTMHPLQTYAHTHSDASQPIKIVSINPVTLIGSRLSNTISNPIDKTL